MKCPVCRRIKVRYCRAVYCSDNCGAAARMLKMQNPQKYSEVLAPRVTRAREIVAEEMAMARIEYAIGREVRKRLE